MRRLAGKLEPDLLSLLHLKNGFYAFESALHVFPAGGAAGEISLELWNSPELWRGEYADLTAGCLFFAEDAFGSQFCIYGDAVYRFDPETANREPIAKTVEEWAGSVLQDYAGQTGYPLAHEWQMRHGPLAPRTRLFAKQPFVLGGDYSVENLRSFDAVAGMRFFASIATQVHDLPDGTKLDLRITDWP